MANRLYSVQRTQNYASMPEGIDRLAVMANRSPSPASTHKSSRRRLIGKRILNAFKRPLEKYGLRKRRVSGLNNSTIWIDSDAISLQSPTEERSIFEQEITQGLQDLSLREGDPPITQEVAHTPAMVEIVMAKTDGIPDSYVVTLKDSSDQKSHMDWVKTVPNNHSGLCQIEIEFDALNGYSAKLSGDALQAIAQRQDVDSIRQNRRRKAKRSGVGQNPTTIDFHATVQSRAPWGLQRISALHPIPLGSNPRELSYTYRSRLCYDPTPVDVYVIDTGVYVEHDEFGGRASWGYTVPGATKADLDGHGTHIAGIIAGRQFGIAKNAHIIALKDGDDQDNGQTDWTQACFNFVIKSAESSGRRSIVNYSSNWDDSEEILNAAIRKVIGSGITVCASAGNEGKDASQDTPLCIPEVVVVSGTDITDKRCSDSNYGPAVKIFAPGEAIVSAGTGNPSSQASNDGTSFAAAHVAGVMADLLGYEKQVLSPAELLERVQNLAIRDKLRDVGEGSPNLLYNGAGGEQKSVENATILKVSLANGEDNGAERLVVGIASLQEDLGKRAPETN